MLLWTAARVQSPGRVGGRSGGVAFGRCTTAILAALAVGAPVSVAAARTDPPTRYSLAGGCWSLRGAGGQPVPGAGTLRLQATGLGSYLLYGPDHTFLTAHGDNSVRPEGSPSPAADWRVSDAGRGRFTLRPASDPGRALTTGSDGRAVVGPGVATVGFAPAGGCASYPEAELNATGTPAPGEVSYGRVGGILEGHMHWMTFEGFGGQFHCGAPWNAYGIPYALPDCAGIEGPQGLGAPVQNLLSYGNPAQAHDTSGYPKMTAWGPNNLTYEGTYWRWIQRAWLGGLRLMVMGVNENRVLCTAVPHKTNCDEMDTLRRGFASIHALQSYVDAQAGGPGKGFFEIVTDPYQARRVINQGRMAVVLEIEVSEPFGCRDVNQPTCDQAQVDRQLDEMYGLGVRSSLLLNKFDNPLAGVRFDDGQTGVVINAGNRLSAGSFFSAQTCTGPLHDNTLESGVPAVPGAPAGVNALAPAVSALTNQLVSGAGVPGGSLPIYPPPPHCNTRGLTTLGKHVVQRMMDLHMIVNPDHMSQAAVDDTLTLLESRRYSGVISPHGWMDPGNWPRLWKLGGLAFPGHSDAASFVKDWKTYRPLATPYQFGWGYGADLGGLSHQPLPNSGQGISYPFKSPDGAVTLSRQRTGDRTFDYNTQGVSHYGLYADWLADVRNQGGAQLATDMWNGAESYLQMWERADGIPTSACHDPKTPLTARGLGGLRLGAEWVALLHAAGQPQQRNRAWSWCVDGVRSDRATDVAELDPGGKVELVGSTAVGRRAGAVRIGGRARRGFGLRLRRTRGTTWVYAVARRRVRAAAVVTPALLRNRPALKAAMTRLLTAQASRTPSRFVPAPAQAARHSRLEGRSLAGTGDARLNAALALLCHIQR